jgi:phosphoribosyl-ATP pyrophosphohydrolase
MDAQVEVILNRQRKGLLLQEWHVAVLKAAGKWYEPGSRQAVPILTDTAQAIFDRTYKRPEPKVGYHIAPIPHGVYGQMSKVVEEIHEAMDAYNQGNHLMVLLELSDVILAMHGVTQGQGVSVKQCMTADIAYCDCERQDHASWDDVSKVFGEVLRNTDASPIILYRLFDTTLQVINRYVWTFNMNLHHLYKMMEATARAFEAGHRKPKHGEVNRKAS